jgi:hypothetical protein
VGRSLSDACSKICSPKGGREGGNLRDRPPLITTVKVNNESALLGVDFELLPRSAFLQGFMRCPMSYRTVLSDWWTR